MLTILCDENIAHATDYLGKHNVNVIMMTGRDIDRHAIAKYNPDALWIRSVTPITLDNLGNLNGTNLAFVGSATIGIDHVDTKFLHSHDITFANATGSSKHSVAQYVMSAILHLHPDYLGKSITLGIIGLGNIGQTLASYGESLGWHILGYDPFLPSSDTNNSTFSDVLSQSDVLSIHTPLTKTGDYPTHQLLNKNTLAHIKPNALLINTARGEIVVQDDLCTAIDDKSLQVVLDVFPDEPNIDKVLLDKLALATPHIAGYTLDGKVRGTDMIYQAFCQAFAITPAQDLNALLPNNPYHWQSLKTSPDLLSGYYDIAKDDKALRAICTDKVGGADFDNLRKTYPLKREWLF